MLISEQLTGGRIRKDHVRSALIHFCPKLCRWASVHRAETTIQHLTSIITESLPQAFEVDIEDCVEHRWWARLSANGQTGPVEAIEFALKPTMDLCFDGRTEMAIQALAHARLTAASMRLIAEAGSCRLVTQGPYRLQLRIELADLGATTGGGCHEAEGLIRFPRHMELSSRHSAG